MAHTIFAFTWLSPLEGHIPLFQQTCILFTKGLPSLIEIGAEAEFLETTMCRVYGQTDGFHSICDQKSTQGLKAFTSSEVKQVAFI